MGCASSSPLVTANGKILEAAKEAASDAVHAGEDALNDVKSSVTETVTNVKEAVVEAVHNVGHGIESAINGKRKETDPDIKDIGVMNGNGNGNDNDDKTINSKKTIDDDPDFKHIPLKDAAVSAANVAAKQSQKMSATALDQLTETINNKSKEYQDETEKLTDDLINETNDIVTDTIETTTNQHLTKSMNLLVSDIIPNSSSPVHSLNSLETNSPEPEIEKAMLNDSKMNPPTPKPTFAEFDKLQSEISSAIVSSAANIIGLGATTVLDNTNNGNNGQVLVSAETSRSNSSTDDTINEDDNKENENIRIRLEETTWEKLADQLIKVHVNKLQGYRDSSTKPNMKRSSSVDNLFKKHLDI